MTWNESAENGEGLRKRRESERGLCGRQIALFLLVHAHRHIRERPKIRRFATINLRSMLALKLSLGLTLLAAWTAAALWVIDRMM